MSKLKRSKLVLYVCGITVGLLTISATALAFTSTDFEAKAQSWATSKCVNPSGASKELSFHCYLWNKSAEQQTDINNLKSQTPVPGPKGDKGDTGLQGIQGLKGDKGDKGDTGLQGTAGTNALVDKSRIYTNYSSVVTLDEFTTQVTALCNDANDVALSGAYIKDRSPSAEVIGSYSTENPSGFSGWIVEAYSTNGRWTIQSRVNCLQVD